MIQEKKNGNIVAIITMFFIFAMISFVTNLAAPFGTIWKNQYEGANTLGMMGNMMNFLAYLFMGIPAGIMLKKFGYKKTALSAIGVGFVGVGVQFLSGQVGLFSIYLVGTFISGFSMCMLNTVVNPMLNTLGGGGNSGNRLLQFGGSINSIGATITPMLVGWLMGAEAGRTIEKANPALFLALGIFALAFIVLSFVNIPEPHMETAAERKVKHSHSPLSFRHFIFGAIAIFIYVGIEIGIPSTANLFMTASKTATNAGLGIEATTAGSIVGVYWLLMLVGRLIGASIGAKVSSKSMMIGVSALGLVLILAAILSPITTTVTLPYFGTQVPLSIVFLVLCGLCTSIMWGGVFNLAVEGLGKYTAAGAGIFMVMVCGGGIVPLIQGFVSDHFGYLNSYWVMFACIAYMMWYALVGCKNVNKDIPVE